MDSSDNSVPKSQSYRPRKQIIEPPVKVLPPPPPATVAVPVEIVDAVTDITPPPFTVPAPNLPPPIDPTRSKRRVVYRCQECGAKHTESQAWFYSTERMCVICHMPMTPTVD